MENDLIKQCEAKAQEWLNSPIIDDATKAEIKAMYDDKTALVDAFYQNLEFGTGGLRGIMGAGTNRMNKYIVGMATQGFANYINKAFPKGGCSVVVGHDCRNNGRMYAESVAAIFSANGIKAYLFESLRPTPEISFAIRQLGAVAGVNVTASHNPKEYNGYKAYWADGAQVLAPHDTGIIDEVNKVKLEDVKFTANWDLIQIIGGEDGLRLHDGSEGGYGGSGRHPAPEGPQHRLQRHARHGPPHRAHVSALMGLPEHQRGARADGR